MPQKLRLLGLAVPLTCAFFSCKHDADAPPLCYVGTVVGLTCYDGLLIDVDAMYPIGSPAAPIGTSVLLGNNIVAVINTNEILAAFGNPSGSLTGKKLFFPYVRNSKRRYAGACYVLDSVKPDVPNVILSNVSTTPCGPTAP